MGQGLGFGSGSHVRARKQMMIRIAAIAGFVSLSGLAIGVPLLSKPTVIVAPPPSLALPTPIPLVNVLMPVQRVAAGTQLSPVMFRVEGMSPVSVAALGGTPIRLEAELVGKYARTLIMPGRPIMADQIMDAPENQITKKIKPGMRAITIQVNYVSGIEGWGLPGTKVDVLWESEGKDDQLVTTIVKNVQILSVSGKMEVSRESAAPASPQRGLPIAGASNSAPPERQPQNFTVTLLVSPDEGQKIFLATRSGNLSLMLRGDFDGAVETNAQASITTKRIMQGGEKKSIDRVEGVVRTRRPDGSFEEWSVIEGQVWRWDQGQSGTTFGR